MKQRRLILAVAALWGFLYYSCVKDDICTEDDTPLLIIKFYDVDDTTAVKAVASLRIIETGTGNLVNTITDRSELDSLAVPLRSFASTTQYQFIINSADDDMGIETGNSDVLDFTYTIDEVFVSRACGFVAFYDNLSPALTADSDNWIKDIKVINTRIENQNAAHVQIFH